MTAAARATPAVSRPRRRGPRFGTHASSAGGVDLAVARAVALRCEAVQVFTRNPNRWQSPPVPADVARRFRDALAASGIAVAVSHASYLINLAAPGDELLAQSVAALVDELRRAEVLGLDGVVVHPGTRGASHSDEQALDRIAAAVRVALEASRTDRVQVLLEHTAGQGLCLGHRFEHLAGVIDRVDHSPRVAVCLDTCHLLASGYDIAGEDGARQTLAAFGRVVGWDRLKIVHANDSKRPCGSRVDRHEHIGQGFVGLEGFRRLVNDRRFDGVPFILETEKQPVKPSTSVAPDPLDDRNLEMLRGLVGTKAPKG